MSSAVSDRQNARRNENEFVHLALVSNLRLSLKHERVVIVQWQKKFDVDGRRIRECLNESYP